MRNIPVLIDSIPHQTYIVCIADCGREVSAVVNREVTILNRTIFDADNWGGQVFHYSASHSTLHIKLGHASLGRYDLFFTGVLYFEGAVGWGGIEFIWGSFEERALLMHELVPTLHNKSQEYIDRFVNMYKLYTLKSTSRKVSVLALDAYISETAIDIPSVENT